jgi:hypothetical protein
VDLALIIFKKTQKTIIGNIQEYKRKLGGNEAYRAYLE